MMTDNIQWNRNRSCHLWGLVNVNQALDHRDECIGIRVLSGFADWLQSWSQTDSHCYALSQLILISKTQLLTTCNHQILQVSPHWRRELVLITWWHHAFPGLNHIQSSGLSEPTLCSEVPHIAWRREVIKPVDWNDNENTQGDIG